MRFELSFQVSQDHVDKFVLNHVLVMQLMSTLLVMFCRGLWAQVCFKSCIQPLTLLVKLVRWAQYLFKSCLGHAFNLYFLLLVR